MKLKLTLEIEADKLYQLQEKLHEQLSLWEENLLSEIAGELSDDDPYQQGWIGEYDYEVKL